MSREKLNLAILIPCIQPEILLASTWAYPRWMPGGSQVRIKKKLPTLKEHIIQSLI